MSDLFIYLFFLSFFSFFFLSFIYSFIHSLLVISFISVLSYTLIKKKYILVADCIYPSVGPKKLMITESFSLTATIS